MNSMIGFALCHGWSFDASALAPLQAALARRFPGAAFAVFDLGFTGAAHTPVLAPGREWIALGHSYGFAYLMQQPVVWKAAVSINGFTRFCRRPGRPEGTPVRLLDAMIERLAQDPRATVADFHQRCGAAQEVPEALDPPSLRHHLGQLRELDLAPPACPTLALATPDDAIVPLALARACFSAPDVTLQELAGDHARLLREPADCALAVSVLIEKLYA
ncbi:MAG: alpha/beta hydrolase [Burkholderiaceae bacterium]|nr:alpha/beta hydrolase [Burkholderiaceae bacterium]